MKSYNYKFYDLLTLLLKLITVIILNISFKLLK